MSSAKQKWYKYLAVAMLALFAIVWLGTPFAVYADEDATPTDATETIPKDLFNYYPNSVIILNTDGYVIAELDDGKFSSSVIDTTGEKGYENLSSDSKENLLDTVKEYEGFTSFVDMRVSDANIKTLYVYDKTNTLLYTIDIKDISLYSVEQSPDSSDQYEKYKELIDSTKLVIKSYKTDFVYDDKNIITGVKITGEANMVLDYAETIPLTDMTVKDNTFSCIVETSHDITVELDVNSGFLHANTSIKVTGIDAHNNELIDDTLPEIDYTDLDVTFEGIPAKGTYNEGQEVTLTMKATTPSELKFDDARVTEPYGKEGTVTISKNGNYIYSAIAENGQQKTGILEVDFFNYVDKDGNIIPDDESPDSPTRKNWSWEDRQNPWTRYVDEADNYLVQTGIYEKANKVPTLAIIWVSIISIITVGGFIYYKKGVKRNEEK